MDLLPVVLDMDPGVDDALALMLALNSPEVEVLGVSTVNGNVPVEDGTRNALGLLGLLGRLDVRVYEGADRPLRRAPVHAREVHGERGLGDAALPDPGVASAGDGVAFLVESLRARPGEVTLIAVGPLTNLALAEAWSPGVLKLARQVVVMGGAVAGPGNVTPAAEFNFYADPEAARQVVRSGAPVVLVPLDVTHRVGLDAGVVKARIEPQQTARARFAAAAVRPAMEYGLRVTGYAGIHLHDPVAVGWVVAPALFRAETVFVDVETEGELTAGQVVADRRRVSDAMRRGYRTLCVVDVDVERFLTLFLERVPGKI